MAEGITRVDTAHAYSDYRSTRYRVRFTIAVDSVVGELEHHPSRSLEEAVCDRRTTARHAGYQASQKVRKRVESIFGWMTESGRLLL